MGTAVDTRQRILDVAVDLFAELGYDKSSIRELASRLGFTTAALYYHFRTKQEILVALADRAHTAIRDLIEANEDEPPSAARSRRILEQYLDVVAANAELMTVLESSIATLRTLDVGQDSAATMERLADLIARDDTAGSRLRATAALGILTTLPVRMPEARRGKLRAELLAAAYGAFERQTGAK